MNKCHLQLPGILPFRLLHPPGDPSKPHGGPTHGELGDGTGAQLQPPQRTQHSSASEVGTGWHQRPETPDFLLEGNGVGA